MITTCMCVCARAGAISYSFLFNKLITLNSVLYYHSNYEVNFKTKKTRKEAVELRNTQLSSTMRKLLINC